MKKKYKALMIDLDGTAIQNKRDAMPSEKVIDAVMKAHKKVFVCVATGRSRDNAVPVLHALNIISPVILLGGSQVVNGTSQNFIHERPLLVKDAVSLLTLLKPYHQRVLIDEKYNVVIYTDSYKPKEVFDILVTGLSRQEADQIIKTISHISTVAAHSMPSWTPGKFDLNISHVLGTKQHAIYEVAKMLGIDTHEIIGVGDGYNDFPLLMACGLKVAMGNAVAEIKEIADYIAPTVDEDGVADVIEKFIL